MQAGSQGGREGVRKVTSEGGEEGRDNRFKKVTRDVSLYCLNKYEQDFRNSFFSVYRKTTNL